MLALVLASLVKTKLSNLQSVQSLSTDLDSKTCGIQNDEYFSGMSICVRSPSIFLAKNVERFPV